MADIREEVPIQDTMTNGDAKGEVDITVETDLLIVGAGPAGASLASFLATHHGIKGIMIGAAPGTAATPRAHITNMAGQETLRDIGLEEEAFQAATKNENMAHTRWCYTMAGEEFARIYSWGNDPARHGDYDAASPCNHVDLPQTKLEPILVRHATLKGFNVRFDTTFLSFERTSDGHVLSTVMDNLSRNKYKIRSKYLFGCDGGRSTIVRQLKIPLIKKPGQGLAINCYVKAEMENIMRYRKGNLHWVVQPDREHPSFAWSAIVRMVKPWNEWMFIVLPDPRVPVEEIEATNEQWLDRVKQFIGDDSVKPEIMDVSKWFINETVAEYYSDGDNIHCFGDSTHRHPPFNGLGSNTCLQDAFNLAWKIAYVMQGKAGPELLTSFSAERQPVGVQVITRANQGLRDHQPVLDALGMWNQSVEEGRTALEELRSSTKEGRARRLRLEKGIQGTAHEFHALGVEMNQRYESNAVYTKDEGPWPPLPDDPLMIHEIITYPGSRLPHAWLNLAVPTKPISTIDLAGRGRFCLLTGPGGDVWKSAAKKVGTGLGVEIASYSIGWRQDYEDVYSDWARRREIEEDGCVLVRPDRFVAWRSKEMIEGCEEKLMTVMKSVLSR